MVFDILWGRTGTTPSAVLVECRHCGTTLEPTSTECPCCGRMEIARYELS